MNVKKTEETNLEDGRAENCQITELDIVLRKQRQENREFKVILNDIIGACLKKAKWLEL